MKRISSLLITIPLLLAVLLTGCNSNAPASAAGKITSMTWEAFISDTVPQSKLTMVNVWATYCGPCLNEMPDLGELASEYEPDEFQIIGIVSDVLEGGDLSTVESLVQQTGANYTHLLLNESLINAIVSNVSAVPTTFFLDEHGEVIETVVGARSKAGWEDLINGLLEKL